MLDDIAAAAAAEAYIADLESSTSPIAEPYRSTIATNLERFIKHVYSGIVANAVVLPTGIPPMSNSGGPVVGAGKIT